jgi:hypothetical protein
MTEFINEVKNRLQHYSNWQQQASNRQPLIHVTMLTQLVRALEQQPYNITWQKDVLQTFQNVNNYSFSNTGWSQSELNQFKAELHTIIKYFDQLREE